MDKLQEIKNKVTQKNFLCQFDSISSPLFSKVIDEIAERYAIAVAEHNREKCADNARFTVTDDYDKAFEDTEFTFAFAGDESPAYVKISKQSILKTPIELI